MSKTPIDDMICGHGKDVSREHCDGCDRVWLRMMIESIEKDLLKQKRRAFDLGEHDCHIALSNAESECRGAIKAMAQADDSPAQEQS